MSCFTINAVNSQPIVLLELLQRSLRFRPINSVNASFANIITELLKTLLKLFHVVSAHASIDRPLQLFKIALNLLGLPRDESPKNIDLVVRFTGFLNNLRTNFGKCFQRSSKVLDRIRNLNQLLCRHRRDDLSDSGLHCINDILERLEHVVDPGKKTISTAEFLPFLKHFISGFTAGSENIPQIVGKIRPHNLGLIIVAKYQFEGLHPAGAYGILGCIQSFNESLCFLSRLGCRNGNIIVLRRQIRVSVARSVELSFLHQLVGLLGHLGELSESLLHDFGVCPFLV